jgi:hypothetical protein
MKIKYHPLQESAEQEKTESAYHQSSFLGSVILFVSYNLCILFYLFIFFLKHISHDNVKTKKKRLHSNIYITGLCNNFVLVL